MKTSNRKARPLLRGILVEVGPWRDDRERPGYQRRWATIAVWCPHCAEWHHHGWNPADDGTVASHRVAHCPFDSESPFEAEGYYISTLRKSDPGYTSHVTTPGKALVRVKPEGEA